MVKSKFELTYSGASQHGKIWGTRCSGGSQALFIASAQMSMKFQDPVDLRDSWISLTQLTNNGNWSPEVGIDLPKVTIKFHQAFSLLSVKPDPSYSGLVTSPASSFHPPSQAKHAPTSAPLYLCFPLPRVYSLPPIFSWPPLLVLAPMSPPHKCLLWPADPS